MNLIQRVQDILLKPKDTWQVIESEATSTASIYTQYLVYLAAIPAIAGFIGMSMIGIGFFGIGYHMPLVAGLIAAIVRYVVSLIMIFVLALIVDALAPSFNGTKNSGNALKLVAYASTAGFVAGIFTLIPMLGILGTLVSLYSIYLLYIGLPTMMKCPPEKAIGYTVVVVICAIVAGLVIGAVTSMNFGGAGFSRGGMFSGGNASITGTHDVTAEMAKIQEAASKMQDLGKQIQRTQDAPAAPAPAPASSATAASAPEVVGDFYQSQDLKALLPESIGEFKRISIGSSGAIAGLAMATANASYRVGAKEIQVSIVDKGASAEAMAINAVLTKVTMDNETADSVRKVYTDGKHGVEEQYQKDGSNGSYTVNLENDVMVSAHGNGVDIAVLKSAVNSMNVGKIAAMKRPAKQQ